MSKIEPNIIEQSTLNLHPQKTQINNSSKINNSPKANIPSVKENTKILGNNSFFKWGRIKNIKNILSVKPINPTDIKSLKNLSNEALIAKLSNINISLDSTENLNINEQTKAEISLGKTMINEHVRRLLLVVNAKNDSQQTKSSTTFIKRGLI